MVGSQAHQNVLRELMLVLLQDCFEFLQRPSLTLPTLLVCFTFSCHYLRTHLYYIYIILLYVYMCMICMCIIYIYMLSHTHSPTQAPTHSLWDRQFPTLDSSGSCLLCGTKPQCITSLSLLASCALATAAMASISGPTYCSPAECQT